MESPVTLSRPCLSFLFLQLLKRPRDLVPVASPSRKAPGNFMCAASTRPLSPPHLELRHFGMAGDRAMCDGDT